MLQNLSESTPWCLHGKWCSLTQQARPDFSPILSRDPHVGGGQRIVARHDLWSTTRVHRGECTPTPAAATRCRTVTHREALPAKVARVPALGIRHPLDSVHRLADRNHLQQPTTRQCNNT